MSSKTIVIPAAGLGSRLGSFTKNYSKAMCTLGRMPVISHIIDQFSNDDEIIILLGYKGDLLKQVVEACHPDKNIRFVWVDNYDGEGSGLGYSLHCAYDLLQRPFIFWSCDTILPTFDLSKCDYNKNWSVVSDKGNFEDYRHMLLKGDSNCSYHVAAILPKDVDYNKKLHSYVGVSFIFDYKRFWDAWDINKEAFTVGGESYGLVNLSNLDAYFVDEWIDTGNRVIFEKYKSEYSSRMEETILEKPDEAIWFIDDRVIKFHIDPKFISDRVTRFSTCLCEKQKQHGIMLPQLLSHSANVYSYKRANGIIASKVITADMLHDIMDKYLDVDYEDISTEDKIAIYNNFYKEKTLSRIKKYCNEYEDIDSDCTVNGIACKSASALVGTLNWEYLAKHGIFTNNYHGDFHLENILVDGNKYIMLDWRQNFGKTMIGDIYYDIAKMWHSLIVNHSMVHAALFTVENLSKKDIHIDIHRTLVDTECEDALKSYLINSNKYDYHISELMTAVIFLNIAACHVYPYSKFLFYLGKMMINKFYTKHKLEFWNE